MSMLVIRHLGRNKLSQSNHHEVWLETNILNMERDVELHSQKYVKWKWAIDVKNEIDIKRHVIFN